MTVLTPTVFVLNLFYELLQKFVSLRGALEDSQLETGRDLNC